MQLENQRNIEHPRQTLNGTKQKKIEPVVRRIPTHTEFIDDSQNLHAGSKLKRNFRMHAEQVECNHKYLTEFVSIS